MVTGSQNLLLASLYNFSDKMSYLHDVPKASERELSQVIKKDVENFRAQLNFASESLQYPVFPSTISQ